MQKCETFIFRKLGSDNYLFSENRAASIELIFSYFSPLCTAMQAFIASTTKCLWLNNNMWYSKQAYISLCVWV